MTVQEWIFKEEENKETIDEVGGKSLNDSEEGRSKTVFHSAQHMLNGTHPIPARSPAEREGQTSKEMRTEGGRQKRR